MPPTPLKLDLKKDRDLTIHWSDGTTSVYPIPYLRKLSPSADARQLRDEMARNPLTVLPAGFASGSGAELSAIAAELVGNYALRISFSDGHNTGIYSWDYLREIDPALTGVNRASPDGGIANASNTPPSAIPRTRIV